MHVSENTLLANFIHCLPAKKPRDIANIINLPYVHIF